ncbi:putative beta (1-3) glucanosyltransferase gel3p [Xylariomycetidae sp. FL0641]|nr:putative beta (1-3) glucanosyltransferase gel3p [Xylariomycetidae sp. FL0641]
MRSALASTLLLAANAAALEPIVMKGAKFFTKSGEQFFMKGMAYQQESGSGPGGKSTSDNYKDPLADEAACKRDVPILEKLGINTIRTYAINPDADHDACMKLLQDAGIYVVSDLGEPALSVNRDSPAWNVELFDRYKGVVDNLGKYDNVIGFFSGNEVTNNATNTPASAYVKAATRDTKKYIADKMNDGGRWMGVGYAANDDADIRAEMAQFFNCGDQDQAIDFWGYNIYSWCGESSYTKSGYDVQTEFFSNYSVPVFFAEYGCNSPGGAEGRKWDETEAIYGDKMTPVFSGGIVYMYFQEDNDYGVVKLNGDKATTMKNYDTLQKKLTKVEPSGVKMDAYEPTNSPASCPGISKTWKVAEALPPTPDSDLCECMQKAASCAPADDLDEEDFGDIFGYVCSEDEDACAGIKHDEENGVYGPYIMCNPKQQLAHILDAYYANQGQASTACDFKGKAQVVSSPSTDGTCKKSLEKASSLVEVAATATVADTAATASGGSNSSEDGPDSAAPRADAFFVAFYSLVATAVGATMIML